MACIFLLESALSFPAGAQTTPYSWTNLPNVAEPVFRKDSLSILELGARPDGATLNTRSINEAIASQSRKVGGVVLVPAKLWLTGPLVLRSNVNLHLQGGATLLFTPDKSQYSLVEGVYDVAHGEVSYVVHPRKRPFHKSENLCTGKGLVCPPRHTGESFRNEIGDGNSKVAGLAPGSWG